jgi:hypothetical protein
MAYGAYEIWGYDPGVLKRYAELIYYLCGGDPNQASQYLPPSQVRHYQAILSMLRWRYLFVGDAQNSVVSLADGPAPESKPLPHVWLVNDYRVLAGRDAIFVALSPERINPDVHFDVRQTVILESEPEPKPKPGGPLGTARIVRQNSDVLEIEADIPQNAILLVTDNYSRGWCASPLGKNPQARYQVMPANYVLRAVPLAAGRHHFLLEYTPAGFRVGKWINIVMLGVYGVLWLGWGISQFANKSYHSP